MGRRPKKPGILNQIQLTFERYEFLVAIEKVCPEVFSGLRRLFTEARDTVRSSMADTPGWKAGEEQWLPPERVKELMTPWVARWASAFRISDTWIESYALDLACTWMTDPLSFANPLPPRAVTTDATRRHVEEFTVTIKIPHDRRPERAWFRLPALREYLRAELDPAFERAMKQLEQNALSAGVLQEIEIPADLACKMEVTALYLFSDLSTEEIGAMPGYARERTTLNRWIFETAEFLNLESAREQRANAGRKVKPHAMISRKDVAPKAPRS
jgi:hypothetical protein